MSSQKIFTSSKSTIETLENGVKYVLKGVKQCRRSDAFIFNS